MGTLAPAHPCFAVTSVGCFLGAAQGHGAQIPGRCFSALRVQTEEWNCVSLSLRVSHRDIGGNLAAGVWGGELRGPGEVDPVPVQRPSRGGGWAQWQGVGTPAGRVWLRKPRPCVPPRGGRQTWGAGRGRVLPAVRRGPLPGEDLLQRLLASPLPRAIVVTVTGVESSTCCVRLLCGPRQTLCYPKRPLPPPSRGRRVTEQP